MLEEQDKDVTVDASYLLELAHRLPELFKSSRTELKNEILKIIFSNFKIQQKNGSSISVRTICEPCLLL